MSAIPEASVTVPPKWRPVLGRIAVDGMPIPEREILDEAQNHPSKNPGEAVLAAARALVVRQLLLQEARRQGVVAERQDDGAGRTETEEDAAIRALVEREVSAPTAGEEECRRFYERNPDRFRSATLYEARHILVPAAPGDRTARLGARAIAERLIAYLREKPGDFADLAAAHSACPSREHGGNLGQITRESVVPEFETGLAAIPEGEIGQDPIESRYGYHVVALDRRIEGKLVPFEVARPRIAAWLEAASWSRAVAQYVSILAAKAKIEGIDLAAADGPLVQ